MKRLPIVILLGLVLLGCQRTPKMVLGREAMARLLVDMELAEAFANERQLSGYDWDSSRRALRVSVMAKHSVNQAVLDSSLRWYARHLPNYMEVLDRCDSLLADTMRRLDRENAAYIAARAGDSVSVWPLKPSAVFARTQASEFVVFEIPMDSTWQRGDVVKMSVSLHNAKSPLNVFLAADYRNRNQTTEAVAKTLYPGDDNRLKLTLQLDSTMSAKRVYGYLRLTPQPGERAFADSIRLMRTRLLSEEYNDLRYRQQRFDRNND